MKNLKKIVAILVLAMLVMTMVGGAAMAATKTITLKSGQSFLRTGPGLEYHAKFAIPKGTTLKVLDAKYDSRPVLWYKVKYNGETGWVSSKYTKNDPEPTPTKHGIYAASGSTYIRKNHYRSAESIGTLPKGATATYLGKSAKDERGVVWYKIKYNGKTGWVSSKYTKKK